MQGLNDNGAALLVDFGASLAVEQAHDLATNVGGILLGGFQ